MTDEDIERRLRSALHAKANSAVGADEALPAMAAAPAARVPLRVLPALAAAALVASVIGGSVLVAGSNRHSGHGHLPTSTAVADPGTTTVGSQAPTGTLSEPPTPVPPSPVWSPTTSPASGATLSPPVAPPRAPQSSPATPPTPPIPTQTSTRTQQTSPAHTSSPTDGTSTVPPTTHSAQPSASATSSAPTTSSGVPTHSPSSAPTKSPTSTPTHPHTSTRPTTPTTSAEPPPPPTTPPCTTASLTIDLGGDRTTGTAGGDYAFLNVTNHGAPCAMSGFPTVRIYDGSGALVAGPASHRATSTPQELILQREGGAQFEVYDVYDGSPGCAGDYRSGRYLQTYLPGQNTAITTQAWGYSPCQLSVTALHAPTSQQPSS